MSEIFEFFELALDSLDSSYSVSTAHTLLKTVDHISRSCCSIFALKTKRSEGGARKRAEK
jgi:hypothetical protein